MEILDWVIAGLSGFPCPWWISRGEVRIMASWGGKVGESVKEKEGISATTESGGISHENCGDTGSLIRYPGFAVDGLVI